VTGRAERELLDGLGGQLYTEAVELGWLDHDDRRFSATALAAARDRLVELGLLQWDDSAGRYFPTDPTATSDRIVVPMAQQGSELLRESAEWHTTLRRLVQVWRQRSQRTGGATKIHSLDAINAFIDAQMLQCQHEVLTAQPYGRRTAETLAEAEPRDRQALERGVVMRTLYQHSARQSPTTREHVAEVTVLGAEVRTLDEFFDRLIVFDRHTALIPGSGSESVAVAITDTSIVAYLADIFDRAWERALPFTVETAAVTRTVADDVRAMALRMLVEGHSDATSAKRMGVSVRTYASYIAALKQEYGVQTRFQLAWAMRRDVGPDRDKERGAAG
jgi:sugar-specific transcriptional regulator TrmB